MLENTQTFLESQQSLQMAWIRPSELPAGECLVGVRALMETEPMEVQVCNFSYDNVNYHIVSMQGPTFTLEGIFLFCQVVVLNATVSQSKQHLLQQLYIYVLKYASVKCMLAFYKRTENILCCSIWINSSET